MKHLIPEAFWGSISESQSTSKFHEEIEQFFVKNEKAETSNLLAKLISMKYKGRRNIREYIIGVSNLVAKLKSLELELDEDLIVHMVLISLPAHFGQFKVSYNTQKNKWSLNELISHYMQEEERLQRDKTEINLTFVPMDTWWVDSGATTHITVTIQGCHCIRPPSDDERFIFECDDNKSQSLDVFKSFKAEVEIQLGKKIKVVKFDHGDEYYVPNIVPEQDYNEVLPQTPIEQPQQPQEMPLRRSIRERRHVIPDDYIVFLQEHEDDIGLIKDDPINFYQAMQSSNSQKMD
ncbi:hypothetical protein CR513_12068, partial [Mucuna pruriens]